ncbi:hypothetical protein ATC03_04180 [Agromyces aureus]|uniref:HTH cro/C1-type domain-containing protein n=2 Tax=Agromyces aureus TaxID=453304 RepID=A0A191WCZ6_9MICO|nr:hypothetical protein ATC03_04180 [Agromyces aureus]
MLIRSTRKSGRLSQRELSERTEVPQARVSLAETARESPRFETVARLLAGTGHRLFAAPTMRDDVVCVASRIREALAADDLDAASAAFLSLNADLAAERGLVRGVLAITEPEPTGSKTWDSALAALVAYRLAEEGVPLPPWVHGEDRRMARARALPLGSPAIAARRESGIADVPAEFVAHGVLVSRDLLDRAASAAMATGLEDERG